MTDASPFQGFSNDALAFLSDLRANNEREWYNAHKTIYESEIKHPAQTFSAAMAAALEELTEKRHGYKIFRIHRDVRFSKDKTPYNAHLHIAFKPEHDTSPTPFWFFGLSPDKLTLGGGNFAFDKADLERFRERVSGSDGTELATIMQKLERQGARLGKPDLKRVPRGYPADHAHADLLRYKGISAWIDHADPVAATKPGLVDACLSDFRQLKPMFDWLID